MGPGVERPPAPRSGEPSISVAVCTRNRGNRIVPTIASILASSVRDFELVIIDQSDDGTTADAVSAFLSDPRVRYIRSGGTGIGPSRAMAVELAAADILAFTDDDCTVPATWLGTIRELFAERPTVAMVYCNVRAASHDAARGFVPVYERPGEHLVTSILGKCPARGIGAGMAVRRDAVLAVGNFDRAFGTVFPTVGCEEGDLTVRLLLNGYHVLESDRTFVVHDGFRTWEQGPELTRRNFVGIGLAYAKPLRCGRSGALPLVLYEGVVVAVLKPLAGLLRGRRPHGLRACVHFWTGFARSFRHPVDRATMCYADAPN